MTILKETISKEGLHPTIALFKELFKKIEADSKYLSQQYEKAQAEYPKLMLAYQLGSIYARFLEKSYFYSPQSLPLDRYIFSGKIERVITWPPEVEGKDIFQQLDEVIAANIEAGAEFERDTRTEVRACPIIRQDYNAAAECVKRYLENPPQTDEEWDEFNECMDKLALYASEMQSHNCKF